MKAEALVNFPLTMLTCVGLMLFFSVFVGMLWWINLRWRRPIYQHLANLPLED
jgi:cbb3-type cytochrome oxidase subunit 3